MDGSPAPLVPMLDLAQAYADVTIGVVIADACGCITFVNEVATDLFAPLQPLSLSVRALLAALGATGGGQLAQAAEANVACLPTRIDLPDGRILDARSKLLAYGGSNISFMDVTAYAQAAALKDVDALTRLTTRANLRKHLDELLPDIRCRDASVAVLFIDLDKFVMVNDALGHAVGDALLVKVAERLKKAARAADMTARLSGDEFVIVQTNEAQPQAAEALAARLVDLIGRTYIAAGQMLTISASVGVAIAPDDGDDTATLMRHADLALHQAKADGRGRFRFFQSGMDVELNARRLLEMDLRRAVALKEFELFYQPQISLASRTLIGFEALLRWRSPARGLVSPAAFIPLAEELGLIGRIGDWVLQTACREAAAWSIPLTVAVNISAMQFRDDDLLAKVKAALAASGLDPTRLELEITEGSLLENTDAVLSVLLDIKALGVRISMDDFGTGYSSLSYLLKFPFDKIKIDQSFVRGANQDKDADAIIRAVVALGSSLGMATIAEGVETHEQLERVRAGGCGSIQGYLTGRPVPGVEAVSMMTVQSSGGAR